MRQDRLREILEAKFSPVHLEIEDESGGHSRGGEATHLRVVMAADAFEAKKLPDRHRAIYACVEEEWAGGLHALTLKLYSSKEWAERSSEPAASPACRS